MLEKIRKCYETALKSLKSLNISYDCYDFSVMSNHEQSEMCTTCLMKAAWPSDPSARIWDVYQTSCRELEKLCSASQPIPLNVTLCWNNNSTSSSNHTKPGDCGDWSAPSSTQLASSKMFWTKHKDGIGRRPPRARNRPLSSLGAY